MTEQNNCSPSYPLSGIVLVDASNLLFGAKGCFGQAVKIDYRKLGQITRNIDLEISYRHLVYFPSFNNDIQDGKQFLGFVNALKRLGWEVIRLNSAGKGIISKEIREFVEANTGVYNSYVFVTGSGELLDLYKGLLEKDKAVTVLAFSDSLSSEVAQLDGIYTAFLGEEVLWHYQRESESL